MGAHPLVQYARDHGNLLITPHIGGCTVESTEKTENFIAGQIAAFFNRSPKRLASRATERIAADMCGLSGIVGRGWKPEQLAAMIASQRHRGPDMEGSYFDPNGLAALALNRLSILDLSPAGRQPMTDAESGLTIALNGEIYNFLELRQELKDYPYHSQTDTEVVLAAYKKWGEACLDRFIGMFAFLIWDERKQRLFAARDRFGVKPLHYYLHGDEPVLFASEIQTLFAGGAPQRMKASTWATYLVDGLHDHSAETFWEDIYSLPPGHSLTWESRQDFRQVLV